MDSQSQGRKGQQQQPAAPDKDWKYLRRCLLAADLYKQTQYFLQGVFDKNTEVISTILATISSVLSDSDELPQTRLRGLRFIKEALEAESISALLQNSNSAAASSGYSRSLPFNVALQHSNILPRLSKLIIDNNVHSDPSTLLLNSQSSSPTQSEAECGYCFYYLCRECLYIWSKLYPNSDDDDDQSQKQSAFALAEQNINESSNCSNSNKLFQLPQHMRFFREEFELKNLSSIFEKMQVLGVLANEKINELANLPREQGFDTGRGLERAVLDFGFVIEEWRNIEKFTKNKNNRVNGSQNGTSSTGGAMPVISLTQEFQQENQTFYKLLMLVCILHQTIRNYQDSKVNYTEMRDLILGFIRDRGELNISIYEVLMDECSNRSENWFDRGCADVLRERRQQEQQFELQSSQAQSRKQLSQQQQQQRIQDQQQQQLSGSQLFKAVSNGSKGIGMFDFEEEKEVERLSKRVALLERDVLDKEQAIKGLKEETKRLELAVEAKQDEFDLMMTKNNYFSYPKDYHELLMKFQKLEADFIEQAAAQLKIKEDNMELLEAKNAYEESKEQLTGIITNQKSTIQQLQITISRLNEEITDFKKNQQNFKKDCERKYAINAVLSGNQPQGGLGGYDAVTGKSVKRNQNSLAASVYPNSSQIAQVKTLKEKDFLRGVLVSDSGKELLLGALNTNNDSNDNNAYAFKLGCLKQSVVILENDFVKVHFKAVFNNGGGESPDEKVEQRIIQQLAAGAAKRKANGSNSNNSAQANQLQSQQEVNKISNNNLDFNDSDFDYEDVDIPARAFSATQNKVNVQISVLNKCGFFLDIHLRVRLPNGVLIRDLQYTDETTRLDRNDCWVQNIQLEMSSLPFSSPEVILTQKSYTLNETIPLKLPITILNIVTWNVAPLPDVLNQFIDIWSDNDQFIRRTAGFNVDRKLIGQTSSLQMLLPGLSQIPSISLNIGEFLGNGYLCVGTMIPFLIKASLINNRFLTFQGRLLENKQPSHHIQALDVLINTLTMVFQQAQ